MFVLYISLDAGFVDLCILLNVRHVEKCLQKPLKGHLPQVQNQYVAFELVSMQERIIPVILKICSTVHIKVPHFLQLHLHC